MIRNRAITDEFEPGSTIKPFVIATALEAGVITTGTTVDTTPGHFNVRGHRVSDLHNYGVLTVDKILIKSSNVGMTKIALKTPQKIMWSGFQKLGFGSATGSGFPGEAIGQLSAYSDWGDVSRATLSYGYGLSVSALQLARAYAALGNGGILVPASLLKRDEPARGRRVFKEQTARTVVGMLEKVATAEGTAKLAAVDGYRVAGKTGTVHKVENGQYADDRYLSLFAGLAPASRPLFVIVVIIDEPRLGDYFGGQVAAPVFSKLTAGLLRIMNVMPDHMPEGDMQLLFAQGGAHP
jgi:cell division protein FtsI (penicillin-binding protein 3)